MKVPEFKCHMFVNICSNLIFPQQKVKIQKLKRKKLLKKVFK